MSFPVLYRICAFLIAFFLSASPVSASDWVIVKLTGTAWIVGPGVSATRATSGMTIPDGATFSTSHNARAKLQRDAETMMVGPNATLSSRHSSFFGTTTIRQQAGKIEYDVEKRNVRHFSVETPYLAAVVKGTRFSVTVSAHAAGVKVDRGLVEVSDPRNGAVADIAAGQRATLDASSGKGLQVRGTSREDKVQPQTGALRPSQGDVAKAGLSGSNPGAGNSRGGKGGGRGGNDGDSSGGKGGGRRATARGAEMPVAEVTAVPAAQGMAAAKAATAQVATEKAAATAVRATAPAAMAIPAARMAVRAAATVAAIPAATATTAVRGAEMAAATAAESALRVRCGPRRCASSRTLRQPTISFCPERQSCPDTY